MGIDYLEIHLQLEKKFKLPYGTFMQCNYVHKTIGQLYDEVCKVLKAAETQDRKAEIPHNEIIVWQIVCETVLETTGIGLEVDEIRRDHRLFEDLGVE